MRIVLRLVAAICAVSVVTTALFVIRFGTRGLSALVASGLFGYVTLFGWAITFVAGPIAAVQLFRLKRSGRVAAAVLFGTSLAYYAIGVVAFRQASTAVGPIMAMTVLSLLLLTAVLSPAARRACIAAEVTAHLIK